MSGMTKSERLTEMKRLYVQRAYTDIEMAERLGVDRTTVYRDRVELTSEYPIELDAEGRYRIDRSKLLSEIKVNLHEALALYLAARKASRQTRYHQPHAASALEKLAATLRQPMTERLLTSADQLLKQEKDPERIKIIETLTQAWVEQKKVRIRYQRLGSKDFVNHTISPYLIEPSIWSDSVYVIALSDVTEKLIAFRVDRINTAVLSGEEFEIPADFDDQELLKHAWGIWYGDKPPVTVKLRFSADVTRRVKESIWHPLEKVTDAEDGGCIWSADVAEWREMLPWIRGWGADCEVLEPRELRDVLMREAHELAKLYNIQIQQSDDDELIAHWRKRDKTAQSLLQHLLETSQLAEQFAAKVGLPEVGKILGLLHDFGKASDKYQKYLRSGEGLINPDNDEYVNYKAEKGKIDHSTAGAQLVYQKLASRGREGKFLAQFLALAMASHHSGMIDCLTPDGKNNFQRRMEKPDEDTHFPEAVKKLPNVVQQLDEILSQPIEQRFLEKLKGMKDTEKDATLPFKHGLLARFLLSCLLDADRLNTADFEFPENEILRNYGNCHPWSVLVERLEKKFAEFESETAQMPPGRALEVNQLRAQVAQACLECAAKPKSIYQLTVPTGGGKTLASLRFALHHAQIHTNGHEKIERIFYVVPYTTIIDQNADKVREILEDTGENGKYLDKVVLEHHSNLTPEDETRRHSLLAENWDAPIVFTTQVQFLETLFGSGTRNARRMHQLANAVIILDEVQTIPINIVHLLNAALRFLTHDCGSTVVLCTATQPPLDKLDNPYRTLIIRPEQKIIQNEQKLFEKLKRAEVRDERKPGGWNNTEIADLAERALREKSSLLVVVNTKASAQALYLEIKARNLTETFHLSTNMCPAHRLEVLEKKVKSKLDAKEPVICVSTQLIEAGVDIDFGAVIRYLAGLDSIAQSAGRCNRHGKRDGLGSVWVVNPQEENLSQLRDIQYGRDIGSSILNFYQRNPANFGEDRIGLKAIAQYYETYFQQRKHEQDYPVGKSDGLEADDTLFNLLSRNRHADKGQADNFLLKQAFKTASRLFCVIDSPTIGVIVPYGEGKELITALCGDIDLRQQRDLLKRAQRYSTQLFRHQFNLLNEEKGAIHQIKEETIFYLDPEHYSHEFGWSEDPVSNQELLCY